MDYDANLGGMKPGEAREYLLAHMTNLIRLRKEIAALESEAAKWSNRVALAAQKGMDDLRTAAEAQEGELRRKLENLRLEESDLAGSVISMKGRLPGLAARERSVDADLLLAELQIALDQLEAFGQNPPNSGDSNPEASGKIPPSAGDIPKLDRAMKEIEAENELAALKNKMKG